MSLVDSVSLTLLGTAVHAAGLRSLRGLGEITLRDSLIAGVATEGARRDEAWIFKREVTPAGWTEEAVDLVVMRAVDDWVSAIELKWWKKQDVYNAGNRRKQGVRDIVRCASVASTPGVSEECYFVLVTTKNSWQKTTKTTQGDGPVATRLKATKNQSWNLPALAACPAVKGAIKSLLRKNKTTKVWHRRLPVPRTFNTRLVASYFGNTAKDDRVYVKTFRVRVPDGTAMLSEAEMRTIAGV